MLCYVIFSLLALRLNPATCFVLVSGSNPAENPESGYQPGTMYVYSYASKLSLNGKSADVTSEECSALNATPKKGRDLRADLGMAVAVTPLWSKGKERLLQFEVSFVLILFFFWLHRAYFDEVIKLHI